MQTNTEVLPMLTLGMPTLIELPDIEDCARLCRELGLQFVELSMCLPQYQTDRMDINPIRESISKDAFRRFESVYRSKENEIVLRTMKSEQARMKSSAYRLR